MYAVFMSVDIAPERYEESIRDLHEHIIPMSKGAPGFVRGTWFGSEQSGHCVMVFDSEQSARQMAEQATTKPEDPVQISSREVYQVEGEA